MEFVVTAGISVGQSVDSWFRILNTLVVDHALTVSKSHTGLCLQLV